MRSLLFAPFPLEVLSAEAPRPFALVLLFAKCHSMVGQIVVRQLDQ
jgi:hypothetical protein